MSVFVSDLRYAFRMLAKSPGFTAVIVLTLALGIGANTAVFSVVSAVALGPRQIPDGKRVAYVFTEWPQEGMYDGPVSVPDFLDWREQSNAFADMGILGSATFNLSGTDRPERVRAVRASASVLPVLGFDASVGRIYGPDEDRPGADPVALLSYSLWGRRFGADPGVVGQTITLDGAPTTVLGVLPPELERARGRFDLWVPFKADPASAPRGRFSYLALGRLRPGVSVAQAQSEMTEIARRLAAAYPQSNQGVALRVTPFREASVDDDTRSALSLLLVGSGLLLLIACVNVANLLLAKATTRRREFAVRVAVGAGRWQLVRPALVESTLLALVSGGAGVLLAVWGLEAAVGIFSDTLPRSGQITVDRFALLFALLISLVSATLFGLVPALRSPCVAITDVLREGVRSASSGKTGVRVRASLVVAQLAMALALVTCAGLMMKSVLALQAVDPGFEKRRLLTMQVTLGGDDYRTAAQRDAFFESAVRRIRDTPGVTSAAAVSAVPLTGSGRSIGLTVEEGRPGASDGNLLAGFMVTTPGYFQTMGIPLVTGRDFTELDGRQGESVVIVSKRFAELVWPGQNPLGRRLKHAPRNADVPWRTVIGVADDVRHFELTDEFRHQTYIPQAQADLGSAAFVVRTAGPPMSIVSAAQGAVWEVDPDLAVYRVQSMEDIVFANTGESGALAKLLSVFGTVALALATIGLYGVMSFAVGQRTSEFGIRMALGARRQDILQMVMSRSILLTLFGVVAGIALALLIVYTLESLMYGVSPTDPTTFVGVSGLFLIVALLAGIVPARRAARVDPMTALRCE